MNEIINRSAFLYDYVVTNTTFFLPFQEGVFTRLANIRVGSYTFSSLSTEIARAMNEVGSNEYLCSTDRDSRKFTISADGTFDLLIDSIYSESDIFDILGFVVDDKAGATTYTSDNATGVLFKPQFTLQNFTDFDNKRVSIGGTRNESANGVFVENVIFGFYNVMKCNITNVTENEMIKNAPIENNQSAVDELRSFMEYITELRPVEFIPDRSNNLAFTECLLNRTPESRTGQDFEIKRVRGSNRHYETGNLEFRRI